MYPTCVTFTIEGEPASKANSRKIAIVRGRVRSIKSAPALDFERAALLQIPASARLMLEGPVRVTLRIFYRTERRDLDEALVLDAMQARYVRLRSDRPRVLSVRGVYLNDRQVREKHVFHGIDAKRPRVEVAVEPIEGGDE